MTTPSPKLSKNQKVVLDALRDGRPLSAYQILDLDSVRDNGLKAPLTIYRALDKLIEYGLVHRIETLNAFVLCDHEPHAEPAAFMICNACKRTIEVGTRSLRRTVMKQAAEQGFEVDHMHVEVSGRCEDCTN
ncbi:MAG: Fur family transcriptional regulator [Hyphomicrobiaceae bacterium]